MSNRVSKESTCKIARNVIQTANVKYDANGEILEYEVFDTKDVLDMTIIEEYDMEAGEDLIDEVEIAIKVANNAEKRFDSVYLGIDEKYDEVNVMAYDFSDESDHVALYKIYFTIKDNFVLNYIKNEFEKEGINVCNV